MIVGIDLGTTNSVMAFLDEEQETEIIENSKGDQKTPSVVLLEDDEGDINAVVGETADREAEDVSRPYPPPDQAGDRQG